MADRCQRCKDATGVTLSVFNTEWLCLQCKQEERDAPGYANAASVEEDAVRAENYNFEGVGLSAEDRAFLAERRAQRSN